VPRPAPILLEEDPFETLDFKRLYEKHGEFIRALLGRLLGPAGDADDLTQEVFMVALRRLSVDHVRSPRAWLCQIAVNVAATARRRYRIRRFFGFSDPQDPGDSLTPEALAEARERIRNVEVILGRMSEKKRTVFILFEVQGLSGQEIADVLCCPLQTVHTRLYHARREFMLMHRETTGSKPDGGGDE
jgi:RNA polymerase sigma-70 factor (ECF subfamily)